jgi:glycosyltransferase involved in cell wall biosynthesis
MDLSSSGKGGGPFTVTTRIMNSGLTEKYKFRTIQYKTELGSGISIKRIKDLKEQIEEINPDIVHFSGLQLAGFHMALACKFARVKNTVITVHGFSGDALNIGRFKKFVLSCFMEPLSLLLSSKVVAVSEYVKARTLLRVFARGKRRKIYNLPPKFRVDGEGVTSTLRKELEISSEDVVVVTVGRIVKDKGYNVMEQAILKLRGEKNVKFVIVGEGSYLEDMKSKLQLMTSGKQVHFLGYRADISNILSGCDLFVLPTLHETLSCALLEASEAGLALVASDTGGVPEIVANGDNGELVKPGSVEDLSETLLKLVGDRDLLKQYGENARVLLEEKFSRKAIENELDKLYSDLI